MAETLQSQTQQNTAQEFEDPYLLTEYDEPMTTLTHEKFNGDNYFIWSRLFRAALRVKNKLGFIDGSLPKPGVEDEDYERWITCDSMVKCWIMNSMELKLSEKVVFADSAQKMWSNLCDVYKPSYINLMYNMHLISQGDSSVSSYYGKLMECWCQLDELAGLTNCNSEKEEQCGCDFVGKYRKYIDHERLMQFLNNLSNKFQTVKWQILLKDPLPSVEEAFYSVLRVEDYHLAMQKTTESAGSSENSSQNKFCIHCEKEGHVKDQCFEINGYPRWWFKGKKNRSGSCRATTYSGHYQ